MAEAHLELFSRYMHSDVRAALYPTHFRSALLGDDEFDEETKEGVFFLKKIQTLFFLLI